jgi:hypothetical protein
MVSRACSADGIVPLSFAERCRETMPSASFASSSYTCLKSAGDGWEVLGKTLSFTSLL